MIFLDSVFTYPMVIATLHEKIAAYVPPVNKTEIKTMAQYDSQKVNHVVDSQMVGSSEAFTWEGQLWAEAGPRTAEGLGGHGRADEWQ
mmetsp:Transcript_31755/g.76908  ORF Transcript_31755/g.76908 Transcript_31755/m.76908 type:complete len:88 (-) Transcript_31755:771-1034(-)